MISYPKVIERFEIAYKHMGQCAKGYIEHDIEIWEEIGMIDTITANVMRSINNDIYNNGGTF